MASSLPSLLFPDSISYPSHFSHIPFHALPFLPSSPPSSFPPHPSSSPPSILLAPTPPLLILPILLTPPQALLREANVRAQQQQEYAVSIAVTEALTAADEDKQVALEHARTAVHTAALTQQEQLDGILAEVAELRAENMRLASDLQQQSTGGDAGDAPVGIISVGGSSDGLDEMGEAPMPRGSSSSPSPPASKSSPTAAALIDAAMGDSSPDAKAEFEAVDEGRESGGGEEAATNAKAKLSPRLGASAGEGGGEAAAQRKLVLDLDWE